MRLFICLACLFLMATAVLGFADEVTSEQPTTEGEPFEELTLNEYLFLIKANHPFFTKEELLVEIEEKQAESLLDGQDWIISVTPSYSYLGEATAPEFQAEKRVHLAGVEAGLNRALWSTGGRPGFSVSSEYMNSDTQFGAGEIYKHGFGVSYTHPFLQNQKGILDRLEYELSDYTIDLTEIRAVENQEDFLLEVAIRYIDWVFFPRLL